MSPQCQTITTGFTQNSIRDVSIVAQISRENKLFLLFPTWNPSRIALHSLSFTWCIHYHALECSGNRKFCFLQHRTISSRRFSEKSCSFWVHTQSWEVRKFSLLILVKTWKSCFCLECEIVILMQKYIPHWTWPDWRERHTSRNIVAFTGMWELPTCSCTVRHVVWNWPSKKLSDKFPWLLAIRFRRMFSQSVQIQGAKSICWKYGCQGSHKKPPFVQILIDTGTNN